MGGRGEGCGGGVERGAYLINRNRAIVSYLHRNKANYILAFHYLNPILTSLDRRGGILCFGGWEGYFLLNK